MSRRVADVEQKLFKGTTFKMEGPVPRNEGELSGDQAASNLATANVGEKQDGPADVAYRKDIGTDQSDRCGQVPVHNGTEVRIKTGLNIAAWMDGREPSESTESCSDSVLTIEWDTEDYVTSDTESLYNDTSASDNQSYLNNLFIAERDSHNAEESDSVAVDLSNSELIKLMRISHAHFGLDKRSSSECETMNDVPGITISTAVTLGSDELSEDFTALAYSSAEETSYVMAHELENWDGSRAEEIQIPQQITSSGDLDSSDSGSWELKSAPQASYPTVDDVILGSLLPLEKYSFQDNRELWATEKMSYATARRWRSMDDIRTVEPESNNAQQTKPADNNRGSLHFSH